MEESKKAELLRGMFAGTTFQNSVVVGVAESGSTVCYQGVRAEKEPRQDIVLTRELLHGALPQVQGYLWGQSAYAILYCVGRDAYHYQDSMSQFERDTGDYPNKGSLSYVCPEGTLADAFRHNSFLRLHIDKWKENGVKERVLLLAEQFRTAIQKQVNPENI